MEAFLIRANEFRNIRDEFYENARRMREDKPLDMSVYKQIIPEDVLFKIGESIQTNDKQESNSLNEEVDPHISARFQNAAFTQDFKPISYSEEDKFIEPDIPMEPSKASRLIPKELYQYCLKRLIEFQIDVYHVERLYGETIFVFSCQKKNYRFTINCIDDGDCVPCMLYISTVQNLLTDETIDVSCDLCCHNTNSTRLKDTMALFECDSISSYHMARFGHIFDLESLLTSAGFNVKVHNNVEKNINLNHYTYNYIIEANNVILLILPDDDQGDYVLCLLPCADWLEKFSVKPWYKGRFKHTQSTLSSQMYLEYHRYMYKTEYFQDKNFDKLKNSILDQSRKFHKYDTQKYLLDLINDTNSKYRLENEHVSLYIEKKIIPNQTIFCLLAGYDRNCLFRWLDGYEYIFEYYRFSIRYEKDDLYLFEMEGRYNDFSKVKSYCDELDKQPIDDRQQEENLLWTNMRRLGEDEYFRKPGKTMSNEIAPMFKIIDTCENILPLIKTFIEKMIEINKVRPFTIYR